MRLRLGIRTATLLALALLWAAPAAAHDTRAWGHAPRKAQRAYHHDHGHHRGQVRHGHGRYEPRVYTHYVRGRPVRVVMHQPFYCAACRHYFRYENTFHDHLHRHHRLARRDLWRHLVRLGWGWAFFG